MDQNSNFRHHLENEYILLCSHCGCDYLHHHAIDVHERDGGEDGETKSARVYGGKFASTVNPSTRRDGVVILFWCENCIGITELRISQHKGNTFVDVHAGAKSEATARGHYE